MVEYWNRFEFILSIRLIYEASYYMYKLILSVLAPDYFEVTTEFLHNNYIKQKSLN